MITPISKYRKLRSKEKKQLAQSLPKTSYFSRVVGRKMESTDIHGNCECQGTWKGNVKVAIHGPLDGRESWMIWGWGGCHHKGPYKQGREAEVSVCQYRDGRKPMLDGIWRKGPRGTWHLEKLEKKRNHILHEGLQKGTQACLDVSSIDLHRLLT